MRASISRIWQWLRRPSAGVAAGTLLAAGFVAAIAFAAGFTGFVEYTNTMPFCTSCHAMREFVYAEYRQSPHYRNSSGVSATCADCHVPRAFIPKLARKIKATFVEVPSHLMGRIDTPEKFEAHRARLAESVWAGMKANDSRECRECHDPVRMALEAQKPRARARHLDAQASGETCIDCHQGIAHRLPTRPEAAEEEDFTL